MDDRRMPEAPKAWIEALDRADADIVAGRVTSGDVVLQRLRDALADLEANLSRPGSIAATQ